MRFISHTASSGTSLHMNPVMFLFNCGFMSVHFTHWSLVDVTCTGSPMICDKTLLKIKPKTDTNVQKSG